jgi:hypothetical protein
MTVAGGDPVSKWGSKLGKDGQAVLMIVQVEHLTEKVRGSQDG